MSTFSTLGIGAGVDLQSMLTKLMALERAPIDALTTKISSTNSQISSYGSLRSKLDALASAATTMRLPSQLSALSASVEDEAVVKASATFIAGAGSYDVTVSSLAAAQKSNTSGYTNGTTVTASGTAKITFTIGDPLVSTVNKEVDLTGGGPYSLADIRNKINDAAIGIRATVVAGADGKQYLSLTSTTSGKAGTFSVATTGLTVSGAQAALSTLTQYTAASDAQMSVDGVTVKSSTNDFSSAIPGVTFTAKSLGTTTVTVATSSDRLATALQSFVDAYNNVSSFIKTNSTYDASAKTVGVFNAESSTRSVLAALNSARSQVPAELASSSIKNLFELGVSVDKTGALSLDKTKLGQAIASSSSDTLKAIQAYGNAFNSAVTNLESATGAITSRISGLNTLSASYTSQKAKLEVRVANIEAGYRKQFTALDRMMSSMQTTSAYLTQQLAALSG